MHAFRTYIHSFTTLTNAEWALVEACLKKKSVKKGEIIHQEGKICKKLYFLEQGLLRFYSNQDGVDVSKFFTQPPYCFTSQRSFTMQKPSNEGIEALEESIIWEMNRKAVYDLFAIQAWSTFARELVQEVQYNTEVILVEMQNQTAEERYLKMLNEKNPLLMQVPLKHLASYLGIAPQSLSRIRKKYVEQL